jgi:hypothetical protein
MARLQTDGCFATAAEALHRPMTERVRAIREMEHKETIRKLYKLKKANVSD